MSKKGKKRQLNEGEIAIADHAISNQNKESDKKLHKKKKLIVKTDNEPEVKNVKSSEKTRNDDILSNPAVVEKLKKLNKKKKKKKKSKMDKNTEDSVSNKNDSDKLRQVKDGKIDGSKKKERYQKKRQDRLESRKIVRQEEGQHSSIMKMSVDELKKKIAEIESRDTISKTAIRKLRILKIKLKVEEGTIESEQSSEKKKDINGSKLLKEKSKKKKQAKNNEVECPLFVEDRVGDRLENSVTKKKLPKMELKTLKKEEKKKATPAVSENKEKSITSNKKNNKSLDKNLKNMKIHQNTKKANVHVDESMSEDDDDIDKFNTNSFEDSDNDNVDDDKRENDDDDDEDDDNDNEDIVDDSDNDQSKMDINEITNKNEKINKVNNKNKKKDNSTIKTENIKFELNDDASIKKFKKEKADKLKEEKQQKNSTEKNSEKKIRYVLFVGNLNYETTTVDLKKHFLTKVEKVKDVRIPLQSGTNKPRGFAYVEFENTVDYEKGLSLHQTTLNGRPIKVMYTTGGSKTANKKQEIIHKNKKLHAMRKKGMLAGSKKDNQKRSFRRNFDKRTKKTEE